jgi:hypothetical protein
MLSQASGVAEKRNRRMVQVERALKTLIRDLRKAQSDLAKLREIGADEPSIRRVMVSMGFGDVTPDEFLAIRTGEDMGRLVVRINRARLN